MTILPPLDSFYYPHPISNQFVKYSPSAKWDFSIGSFIEDICSPYHVYAITIYIDNTRDADHLSKYEMNKNAFVKDFVSTLVLKVDI